MSSIREKNVKIKFNRFMFGILCVVSVIFCLGGCGGKEIEIPTYDDEPDPVKEISYFAIVSNIDEVNSKVTLKAVSYEDEIVLEYTGSADVRNKYGDVMTMGEVAPGSIVDVTYDENRDKLLTMQMSDSDKVQKLESISGAIIDTVDKTMRINGDTYQMSRSVCAFSDNIEIGLDEICSEDQISVWLYNDLVCSVFVELGHGYVRLKDYAAYIGGMVEIGYDVIVPVTEDMLLTVREGEYTLRIAKDEDVGTKKVEVVKNQEIQLSLADILVEPKRMGSILFDVTPVGAAVYIDGKRVNTEGAVPVSYGKHKIDIVAEGYDRYSASFNVDYAYKIKEYKLKKTGEDSNKNNKVTENKTTASNNGTTGSGNNNGNSTTEATTEKKDSNEQDKTANKVTVAAPVGASVYLDGEYIGIAPISFTKVTGSHIITFSMAGYLSKSYTVTFTNDGKDTTLKYDNLVSIASLIE